MDLIEANVATWGVHPVANLEVDQLLDATSDAYDAAALAGPDPEAAIPLERWGVGHYVGIGAFWRGGDGRRWVLLLDTYKARASMVTSHARRVAATSARPTGRPRRRTAAGHATRGTDRGDKRYRGLGLEIRMWGNGSLEPEGWAWSMGR